MAGSGSAVHVPYGGGIVCVVCRGSVRVVSVEGRGGVASAAGRRTSRVGSGCCGGVW